MEHAEFLRKDGGADLDLAVAVSTDWRKAKLGPPDHAMLEFAEKLTLSPSAMQEQDVAALRRHGFDDRDILSIVLAAAYRHFITRVADALGVELKIDGEYAPEVLRAFGVHEADLQTTIYGDRQRVTPSPPAAPPVQGRGAGHAGAPGKAGCWVETTPADPARHAAACQELARLTGSYPRRHLGLAFGRRPEALEAALAFGRLLGMGGSGLGRRMEAIIGLVVAATLWVRYMGVHHVQALLECGASTDEVEGLVRQPAGVTLAGAEREVARFCEKLTRQPSTMCRADVEALRAAGFEDRDIVTIAASAAFENFLCGVAAGLGIQLEDEAFASAAEKAFGAAAPA